MDKILIIPDVHGRPFWKKAVEKYDDYDKIIFLGDYVDPYPYEGITVEMALENLKELSEWLEGKEKVVLLLGNHDMHYIDDYFYRECGGCRLSSMSRKPINDFVEKHKDKIKLAYEAEIEGKKYLFSHAGIISDWYKDYQREIGGLNVDNINAILDSDKRGSVLSDVSFYRGGWSNCGSIVWADIREHLYNKGVNELQSLKGVYQIFGHSQQEYEPIITETFACLDCRAAFELDKYGLKKLEP